MTDREPLLTPAAVTSAVVAVVGLLVAFGVPLTDDQQKALLAVAGVVGPLLVAYLARRKVTPLADPRDDDGAPLVRTHPE